MVSADAVVDSSLDGLSIAAPFFTTTVNSPFSVVTLMIEYAFSDSLVGSTFTNPGAVSFTTFPAYPPFIATFVTISATDKKAMFNVFPPSPYHNAIPSISVGRIEYSRVKPSTPSHSNVVYGSSSTLNSEPDAASVVSSPATVVI